jgi:hypothetical protein
VTSPIAAISPIAYQGVCGRHGGEDASVSQGGLVSSNGKGMAGIVRHSQTKGRATGNAMPGVKPRMENVHAHSAPENVEQVLDHRTVQ